MKKNDYQVGQRSQRRRAKHAPTGPRSVRSTPIVPLATWGEAWWDDQKDEAEAKKEWRRRTMSSPKTYSRKRDRVSIGPGVGTGRKMWCGS